MNEVCLLTAAGFITGTVVKPQKSYDTPTPQNETEKKKIGFDLSIIRKLLDDSALDLTRENSDASIADDASMIKLKNVTIFSTANPEQKVKMQQMIVFVDQIIGFSLNN